MRNANVEDRRKVGDLRQSCILTLNSLLALWKMDVHRTCSLRLCATGGGRFSSQAVIDQYCSEAGSRKEESDL